MHLVRHDDYFGGPAATENIVIQIVPEAAARSIAIESHQVDAAQGITAEEVSLQTAGISAWLTDGALPLELRQLGSGRSMEAFLYSPRRMCRIREDTLTTGVATSGENTSDWGGSLRLPRPMASQ